MKNKSVDVINDNIVKNIKRLPKSISRNEKLQEHSAKSLEVTDDKLETLIKEGKYKDAMEYKEDLVIKSKFNVKKDNLQ